MNPIVKQLRSNRQNKKTNQSVDRKARSLLQNQDGFCFVRLRTLFAFLVLNRIPRAFIPQMSLKSPSPSMSVYKTCNPNAVQKKNKKNPIIQFFFFKTNLVTPLQIELRLAEAGLVGFCGFTSQGGDDFLALLARLGLGVSGWFGRIQDEEVEDDVEEDVQVVKGLFIKF